MNSTPTAVKERVLDIWDAANRAERAVFVAELIAAAISAVLGYAMIAGFVFLLAMTFASSLGWKADARYWHREYRRMFSATDQFC